MGPAERVALIAPALLSVLSVVGAVFPRSSALRSPPAPPALSLGRRGAAVGLGSTCESSVQCAGVQICYRGVCACPDGYSPSINPGRRSLCIFKTPNGMHSTHSFIPTCQLGVS